jgi:hypothetical protein
LHRANYLVATDELESYRNTIRRLEAQSDQEFCKNKQAVSTVAEERLKDALKSIQDICKGRPNSFEVLEPLSAIRVLQFSDVMDYILSVEIAAVASWVTQH